MNANASNSWAVIVLIIFSDKLIIRFAIAVRRSLPWQYSIISVHSSSDTKLSWKALDLQYV